MTNEILKRDNKQIKAIINSIEKLQNTDCLHEQTVNNINFDLLQRVVNELKHCINLKTVLNK